MNNCFRYLISSIIFFFFALISLTAQADGNARNVCCYSYNWASPQWVYYVGQCEPCAQIGAWPELATYCQGGYYNEPQNAVICPVQTPVQSSENTNGNTVSSDQNKLGGGEPTTTSEDSSMQNEPTTTGEDTSMQTEPSLSQ